MSINLTMTAAAQTDGTICFFRDGKKAAVLSGDPESICSIAAAYKAAQGLMGKTCKECGVPTVENDYCSPGHKVRAEATKI